MSGKIIVKPLLGLANRLRVIESGLSLARSVGAPCEVVWVTDQSMTANFNDLFIQPDLFFLSQYDRYKYARSSFSLNGSKKILGRVINRMYRIQAGFSEYDVPTLLWTGKIDLLTYCKDKSSYFFTCQKFFQSDLRYSWLQPVPEVQGKIDDFMLRVAGKPVIGMHIRRTDHAVSIGESPDWLFENVIEDEISKDENVVFFLATDDPATEKKFIGKYGDQRILSNPKEFGRATIEATRDAVVDLISLTKCSKLYCSYWSSFSETAALISGAETIICRVSDKNV